MKTIFSGIQPSGVIHLGNYLGAIKQWITLQEKYKGTFCIVDLHAITVKQDPEELRKNILQLAKLYLALGLDPKKGTIFIQSHVPAHTELAWIFNTLARMSELERMTQFKDKAQKHKQNINVGLFAYPLLMASDILLYDTDIVPVGVDQKQHVELTRELAKRFNHQFGEVLKIPEVQIQKVGAKIYALDDPLRKMSKSDGLNSYISLLDSEEEITKKIKRAVTDSGSDIVYNPEEKPAISNLLTIQSLLSGVEIKELEESYQGKGYGDLKSGLTEVVLDFVRPIQASVSEMSDEDVLSILKEGAQQAHEVAQTTLDKVKDAMGFVLPS